MKLEIIDETVKEKESLYFEDLENGDVFYYENTERGERYYCIADKPNNKAFCLNNSFYATPLKARPVKKVKARLYVEDLK